MEYKEIQRMNQWWLVLILGLAEALLVYSLILYLPHFGQNLGADIAMCFTTVLMIAVGLLPFAVKLTTYIDKEGICIRYFPLLLKPKCWSWEDIDKAYVRKYNPIWEVGGWGLKGTIKKRAYNTKGNICLHLDVKDGRVVLIGTQRPENLSRFLEELDPLSIKQ